MLHLEIFGERLRKLRKENNMVLADVAKLLGTSNTQIGDMEVFGQHNQSFYGRSAGPTFHGANCFLRKAQNNTQLLLAQSCLFSQKINSFPKNVFFIHKAS